eukprot:s1993_g13.t1
MQRGESLLSILSSPQKPEDSCSFGMSCQETEYPQSVSSTISKQSSDLGISAKENTGMSDLHAKSVLDTKLGNLFPTQRLHEILDADCMAEDPDQGEDSVPLTPLTPLTPCPTEVCTMSTGSIASRVGSLPYSLSHLEEDPPEKRLSTFSSFKSYLEHTFKGRSG